MPLETLTPNYCRHHYPRVPPYDATGTSLIQNTESSLQHLIALLQEKLERIAASGWGQKQEGAAPMLRVRALKSNNSLTVGAERASPHGVLFLRQAQQFVKSVVASICTRSDDCCRRHSLLEGFQYQSRDTETCIKPIRGS